jgi:hypothetical protein
LPNVIKLVARMLAHPNRGPASIDPPVELETPVADSLAPATRARS